MRYCWRGILIEKGREAQQEEERLCCNLGTNSCKQGGAWGGGGSKIIGFWIISITDSGEEYK